MSKISNLLTFFLALLLICYVWINFNQEDVEDQSYSFKSSDINLSVMPKNMETALNNLGEKIRDERKDDQRDIFKVDLFENENSITLSTPLVLKMHNKSKDKIEQSITKMPDFMVGLTIQELKSILTDWKISDYKSGRFLILSQELNDLSKGEYRYLGIKNGKVAIFKKDDNQDTLIEVTDIKLDDLPLEERQELREGIKVQSDEELIAILEGLVSYKQD